ncbi:MAG TPA: hypothetical protein ENN40_00670 [Candidatus Aminicenantes bacterium]|nr:hypothetical protein [Candidatus Aminicenantes bacterium]
MRRRNFILSSSVLLAGAAADYTSLFGNPVYQLQTLPENTLKRTIFYGTDPRQKIHIYSRPLPFVDQSRYLVVSIPGGGWYNHRESWESDNSKRELIQLLEDHVDVAYIDFRPAESSLIWPAQMQDWIAALSLLKSECNPRKIGGWGHSAGGHGILTLATHPQTCEDMHAIVAEAAPSNLARLDSFWDRLFGTDTPFAASLLSASPFYNLENLGSRVLLVHGKRDDLVPYGQSEDLHCQVISRGKESKLILLENANHNLMPYDSQQPVVLNLEQIATATSCFLEEGLLVGNPYFKRSRIETEIGHIYPPVERIESKRKSRRGPIRLDALEIKDREEGNSEAYRIYNVSGTGLNFIEEIPKQGAITIYGIPARFKNREVEFLVTRVVQSGAGDLIESRTSRTFSVFDEYCA